MFCIKCGNEIKEKEQFCSKCGSKIKDNLKSPINSKKKKICVTLIVIVLILLMLVASIELRNKNFDIVDVSNDTKTIENADIENDKMKDYINELNINNTNTYQTYQADLQKIHYIDYTPIGPVINVDPNNITITFLEEYNNHYIYRIRSASNVENFRYSPKAIPHGKSYSYSKPSASVKIKIKKDTNYYFAKNKNNNQYIHFESDGQINIFDNATCVENLDEIKQKLFSDVITSNEKENIKVQEGDGLAQLKIENATLIPEFETNKYEYTANYIGKKGKLNIESKATQEDYIVEVIGNENLIEGENLITVLVSKKNGDSVATYQITLNKSLY